MKKRSAYFVSLILAGCAASEQVYRKPEKPLLRVKINTLDEYSPEGSHVYFVDTELEPYFKTGLDLGDCCIREPENPEGFKKDVLKEARKLGYTEDQIKEMPVKEFVILASGIVMSRFDYYGEYVKRSFENFKFIPFFGSYFSDTARAIRGSAATRHLDSQPIDRIFKEGEVVCRHYARVLTKVYEVIKSLNPSLANTSISCFSTRDDHLWNQATTMSRLGNRDIQMDVAFIDPTFADSGEPLDALDEKHFGDLKRMAFEKYLQDFEQRLAKDYRIEIDKNSLEKVLEKSGKRKKKGRF